ncbi:MAG: hypothetical protein AB7Q69_09290 [Gemmatimonadales bacterium]
MAEKLPWFPFYGYLFFDDEAVKLMDDAGVGRYLRLLWHQWIHGSVPTEPQALARLLRVEPSGVEDLLPLFPTSPDGRRRNPKLEEIRTEQELAREGRRRGGLAARGNLLRGRSPGSAGDSADPQPDALPPAGLPAIAPADVPADAPAPPPAALRLRAFGSLSPSQSESPEQEGGAGGRAVPVALEPALQVARAANEGLRANPHLGAEAELYPLRADLAAQPVVDWLAAGIPLDLICTTVREVAVRFRPNARARRIASFAYFDAAVRSADAERSAATTLRLPSTAPVLREVTA